MLKLFLKSAVIYIVGTAAVLVFKFLALFFNLKLVRLNEKRIGHLVFDAEQILRTKKADEIILLTYYDHEPCNIYMHELIKKSFYYSKYFSILHNPKIKKVFKNYEKFLFDLNWKNGESRNLLLNKAHLKPTLNDNEQGNFFLENIGLNPSKIVAVIIRDSAYLSELDYHNYRDCKIENYYPMINYLLNKGYSVIRMGKKMNVKANISHPLFYDYAFSERRSDFLDVWIMMNACEVITTGTGLENITDISNKPYIGINFTPLLHYNSWNSLFWWAPKILCYKKTNMPVPLSEQIKSGSIVFTRSEQYDKAGYILKETSPQLNLLILKEVLQRRAFNYNDLYKKERSYIHMQFMNSDLFETLHKSKKNFNLSSEFIKENQNWLLK